MSITKTAPAQKSSATDQFQAHDHYLVDELLTEEHKLIRDTARKHVSKHLKPIIEEAFEEVHYDAPGVILDWLIRAEVGDVNEIELSKVESGILRQLLELRGMLR